MYKQKTRVYRIVVNPWERTVSFGRYDARANADRLRTYIATQASSRRVDRYLRATDSHIAMSPLGIEYIFLNAY